MSLQRTVRVDSKIQYEHTTTVSSDSVPGTGPYHRFGRPGSRRIPPRSQRSVRPEPIRLARSCVQHLASSFRYFSSPKTALDRLVDPESRLVFALSEEMCSEGVYRTGALRASVTSTDVLEIGH